MALMIAVNRFAAVIKTMQVNSLKQCNLRAAGHGTGMALSHCDAPANITGEDVEHVASPVSQRTTCERCQCNKDCPEWSTINIIQTNKKRFSDN